MTIVTTELDKIASHNLPEAEMTRLTSHFAGWCFDKTSERMFVQSCSHTNQLERESFSALASNPSDQCGTFQCVGLV